MREVSGTYVYHLLVNVANLNTDYTIVIRPYGAGDSRTLRHVIQATP
jgi:hypothetical protein